jgi:hypothetical protein
MATNLVTYPYEFCRHERNRELLVSTAPADQGLARLVRSLGQIQGMLALHFPLVGGLALWNNRDRYLREMNIETTLSVSPGAFDVALQKTLHEVLGTRTLEGVLDQMPHSTTGTPSMEAFRLAAASIWLSDHLALIVLGIASVHVDPGCGSVNIVPTGADARKHLRRVWFGHAFDELSLQAASMTLQGVAYAATHPASYAGDRQLLFFQAVSVFPQHWRLPADSGPVAKLLERYLIPLTRILINVIAAQEYSRPAIPYQLKQAKELGAGEVFEIVRDMQAAAPLVDRLFDIVDGGLVFGSRAFAPGAIAIAEHLAERVLGNDWHGKVSSEQKRYVLERLARSRHVNVLDFELRQHDTSHGVPLDVDFMVRDGMHKRIYAVQLKHFKTSDKGGLLYWISRFRERGSSFGKAAQQLENLSALIKSDENIRKKLSVNGVALAEFGRIVPVVLHNVGPLDFWELQSGILLYDTGTFCNVLDGRSATFVGTARGQVISGSWDGRPAQGPSLHDSDSVITAYLADRNFSALRSFDMAAKAVRTLNICDECFVAQGLGV